MAQANTNYTSEYNQQSFGGGMNMLGDDTHLAANQYRVGFNIRNRYDRLDLILTGKRDTAVPSGLMQELVTFGSYIIVFVSGKAYYREYLDTIWYEIEGFQMSSSAPRYWTKAVPVATTNYLRYAAETTLTIDDTDYTFPDARKPIYVNSVAGAAQGNLPGLLVQDNVNQPYFIYIGGDKYPHARQTQYYAQWKITFTDESNTVIAEDGDQREYVPIGNAMEYIDGVLYIASKDGDYLYRSVSGRPLDFVVNVTNKLANNTTNPAYTQYPGGDASTTAYSVGVGPITALRAMADGSLFVSAGNAAFAVSKNTTQTEFGEPTFIRTFLFNSTCLSDRAIFDTTGDTRFIALGGVRSFNSISQSQNEGRNTAFTATIQKAFKGIVQNPSYAACILYDDFELYSVNTIFGAAIAVFDTIINCWVGFDINQTGTDRIKQFAKIELTTQALFAITDGALYELYAGTTEDVAMVRTNGICSNQLSSDMAQQTPTPKLQVKLSSVRAILNNITQDCECSLDVYVDNRVSSVGTLTKSIDYVAPVTTSTGILRLDDVNTQLQNLYFSTPNAEQGWKTFCVLSWNNGSITQYSAEFRVLTPKNPLRSQQ